MRFRLRRKNSPEKRGNTTKPKRMFGLRHYLPIFAIIGVAAGGITLKEYSESRSPKRPVLQCKYDVKGETIIKKKGLTAKEAKHLKPPENCKKMLCRMDRPPLFNLRGEGKKFVDCEPATEEKLAKVKEDTSKSTDIFYVMAAGLLALGVLGFFSWRLSKSRENPGKGDSQNNNSENAK